MSPSQPSGVLGKLRIILEMIKFEHTLFALPFAMMGMLLAARGLPSGRTLFWIIVAMVGARSSGMAFNRLVDREFDRQNPRTAGRAIPAGLLTPGQVALFVSATAALLVLAAWQLNPLALWLSPVGLGVIWGYSYTKRFTHFCHLFLGASLGIAPSAAWIAVRGSLDWPPVLLSGAVLFWAGGFDIIYSCQDEAFDRGLGLHSIPSRLGIARALLISRCMHLCVIALLLGVTALYPMGPYYFTGVGVVAGLLAYEHSLVRPTDLSRVDAAFFTVNGFVSIALCLFTALDVFL